MDQERSQDRTEPGTQPDESPVNRDESQATRRLTVREAAAALGVTEAAVRNRIRRGTLRCERESGAVYVLLEADEPQISRDESADEPTDQSRFIAALEDQIGYLRDQLQQERDANRENRRIIAGLTQRIPQLEAPSEARESEEASQERPQEPERASGGSGRGDVLPSESRDSQHHGSPQRSSRAEERSEFVGWFRKIFGSRGG